MLCEKKYAKNIQSKREYFYNVAVFQLEVKADLFFLKLAFLVSCDYPREPEVLQEILVDFFCKVSYCCVLVQCHWRVSFFGNYNYHVQRSPDFFLYFFRAFFPRVCYNAHCADKIFL